MRNWLYEFFRSPTYDLIVLFLGIYPVLLAALAINSSRNFHLTRRGIATPRVGLDEQDVEDALKHWPLASVVIPAYNEAEHIVRTVQSCIDLHWNSLEVLVIDDGSTDETAALVEALNLEKVRVIRQPKNQGKAAALEKGFQESRGSIVMIIDADAEVEPDVLHLLARHLMKHPDVAAVTANPRVADVSNIVGMLQAIEFSGTVSCLRRGQAVWGHIGTMSGVCALFRKEALIEVGGWDATQPTEDIEITWRLHLNGWRTTYEPDALVLMYAPNNWASWYRQRKRWTSGLIYTLRRHFWTALKLKNYQMWPVLIEAVAGIVWSHLLVFMTAIWALGQYYNVPFVGTTPLPIGFGLITLTIAIFQVFWGIHLDSKVDAGIASTRQFAILYPLLYWWALALMVVRTGLPSLLRPRHHGAISWKPDRSNMMNR